MRFGKLKIIVGIFLVLFILVVANTIIFGLVQKEMIAVPDKGSTQRTVVIEKNETNSTNVTQPSKPLVENVSSGGSVTTPVDQTLSQPPVTQPRRTRAS